MTLRVDRLQQVTDTLASAIETLDPMPYLPTTVAAGLSLARRFGFDIPAMLTTSVVSFLRSLPASAASDPSRADSAAAWASDVLAWLRDETDTPPGDLVL